MKKRYYKELENVCIYFNKKVWRALFELANDEISGSPDTIMVLKNKVVAIYDGYIVGCEGWATYDNEKDKTYYTIPNRNWKPMLISYGFIPKNKKVYFGKYYKG